MYMQIHWTEIKLYSYWIGSLKDKVFQRVFNLSMKIEFSIHLKEKTVDPFILTPISIINYSN